jgi:hypothetical protein
MHKTNIDNKTSQTPKIFVIILLLIILIGGGTTTTNAQATPKPYIDTSGDFGAANWNSSPDISTFQGGTSDSNIPKAILVDENESGPTNARANVSNTGAVASQNQNRPVQNVSGCIASQLLAQLLQSSVTTAINKVKGVAVAAKEMLTRVPITPAGTDDAKNKEADTNARVGTFFSGFQIGVSWDDIGWCIVNTIIDYVVNSTIQWANSGFKGNPAFVRNPEQFFKQIADREAASFINELAYNTTGINVCAPFRIVIATGLRGSYSGMNNYGRYNSCSLSQMQQSAMQSGKYTITTPTDWIALTKPENNVYYSYIKAGEELDKRINVKRNTATLDLTINRGFLSYKKCKDNTKPESKTNPCDTVTPGNLIADSLSSTLNIPKDRLVSAQKFDQMVDTIVNNLIKIALSRVLEDVTGKEASQARTSDYYTAVSNNYYATPAYGQNANAPGTTGGSVNIPGSTAGYSGETSQGYGEFQVGSNSIYIPMPNGHSTMYGYEFKTEFNVARKIWDANSYRGIGRNAAFPLIPGVSVGICSKIITQLRGMGYTNGGIPAVVHFAGGPDVLVRIDDSGDDRNICPRNIIDFYIPNYRFATDSYKWLDGRPLTGIDVAPNASQLTGTSINSITGINWGYKSLYEYDAANGGTVD